MKEGKGEGLLDYIINDSVNLGHCSTAYFHVFSLII